MTKVEVRNLSAAIKLVAVMMTVAVVGCSGGKPAWEKTHPATGTIKFKGKPIVDAELSLFPEDPAFPDTVRPKAKSTTDGKFSLWTYQTGDGAPAGNYKVTVVHHEVAVSKDTIVAKPNSLPEKYARRETTDLKVTISEGNNELPEFDLK